MMLLKILCLINWIGICYAQAKDRGFVVSLSPSFFYYGGLYAFDKEISSYNQFGRYPEYHSFGDDTDIVSMRQDPRRNRILYINSLNQNVMSLDHFNIWMNDSLIPRSIHQGLSDTYHGRIAFDWLTGNLYWTDNKYNWIAVQNVDHMDPMSFKILIHEGVIAPGGIAIDPVSKYLFWAEHGGPSTVIIRSDLEGKNRKTIVTGLLWVPDIIADYSEDPDKKMLYWVDNDRNAIERCDYNGQNRRPIYRSSDVVTYMSSMAIYQNTLCIIEFDEEQMICVDKNTGTDILTYYLTTDLPFAMDMYSVELHSAESHPCQNFGCSDICINVDNGAKCVCREGYEVDPANSKNCVETNLGKQILISNGSAVCTLDIRGLTGHFDDTGNSSYSSCILQWSGAIDYLTVAVKRSALFFFDQNELGIIMYNLTTGLSEKWAATGHVSGLQYDWIGKDIFWSESDSGRIVVASTLQRNQETTLLGNLQKPRGLVINPHGRMLFWIAGSQSNYKVQSYFYGASSPSISTVLDHGALNNPLSLCYNDIHNRLYYIDEGKLKSVDKDGSNSETMLMDVHSDNLLLCFKDYAAHSSGSGDITSRNVYDGSTAQSFTIDVSSYGTINSMIVYDIDSQRQEKNPCENNNGGCQHICIPKTSTTSECKCSFGYVLASDGRNCMTYPKTNNFALTVDFTHGEIYQVDINNGSNINAIDLQRPAAPITAAYYDQHIYWADFATDKLHRSTLTGRNTTTLYTMDESICFSLTVDPSTGNVYYVGLSYITSENNSYIGVIHPGSTKHKVLVEHLSEARSLAIHPAKGLMYWVEMGDYFFDGSISFSNMDGTGRRYIHDYNIRQPKSIAIDYQADTIYWADYAEDTIYALHLGSGNEKRQIYTDANAVLATIAVAGSNVYYTATKRQRITKFDVRNERLSSWMQKEPEMGRLESLAVYIDGNQIPVNEACKKSNGLCSTFCFPMPGQRRRCGCEDGVSLLSDGRTCEGVPHCPTAIPNGNLNDTCSPYTNKTCDYTCNFGYRKTTGVLLKCMVNPNIPHAVKWATDVSNLCEKLPPGATTPSNTPLPPQAPGISGAQTATETGTGISNSVFAAVVVVLILIFLIIILGLLFIMYRRRGSEMFAHAKFVNAPNVPQNSDVRPRGDGTYDNIMDQKVAHEQNTSNVAAASSAGMENPLYKAKNPPPSDTMNQNTYTTIEISKF